MSFKAVPKTVVRSSCGVRDKMQLRKPVVAAAAVAALILSRRSLHLLRNLSMSSRPSYCSEGEQVLWAVHWEYIDIADANYCITESLRTSYPLLSS